MILLFVLALSTITWAQDELFAEAKARIPPLKVRSITPASDASGQSFMLSGRTAITVVFNRAVIALGSDWGSGEPSVKPFRWVGLDAPVPGKLRWVTTSIARFDPDLDWPTDLRFTIEVDQNLTTYDGSKLSEASVASFTTPRISFSVASVTSALASAMTDNGWDGRYGWGVRLPSGLSFSSDTLEVPSDGVVRLQFSAPVELALVAQSMQIAAVETKEKVGFNLAECKEYSSATCLQLTIANELSRGKLFQISMPVGAKYHRLAGRVQEQASDIISGLFPFEFPFLSEQFNYNNIGSRSWLMYLRHGLAANFNNSCTATDCSILKPFFSLLDQSNSAIAFKLTRPHAATLLLQAPVDASQRYQVAVLASNSTLDGFGQPLRAGMLSVKTDPARSFETSRFGFFERNFNESFSSVHRMQGNSKKPINSDSWQQCRNVATKLMAVNVNASNVFKVVQAQFQPSRYALSSFDVVQPYSDSTDGVARTTSLSAPWSLSQTYFVAQELVDYECRVSNANVGIVSRANLAIAYGFGISFSAIVTRPSDNSPVVGAKVSLYGTVRFDEIEKLDEAITDQRGLISIKQKSSYNYLRYIVVTFGDELLLERANEPLYSSFSSGHSYATATTDRNLYKEGDTVFVKGYNRFIKKEGSLARGEKQMLSAEVQWISNEPNSIERVSFEANEFGAFTFELHVPAGVDYETKYATIQGTQVTPIPIKIADPRIPTAVMSIKSNSINYAPSVADQSPIKAAGIEIELSSMTYTGAPLANSEITVDWSISRSYTWSDDFSFGISAFEKYLPRQWSSNAVAPKGTRTFVTGKDGKLTTRFELSDAELKGFKLEDGMTISLSARMIGPTREQLTSTVTVPVRSSPWQLLIKTTSTIVPGIEFGVFVDVVDAQGSSLMNKKVSISLTKLTTEELAASIGALVDVQKQTLRTLKSSPASQCNAVSNGGRRFQCKFLMTEATKFVLIATVIDDDGNQLQTAMPVGQSAAEWAKNPLAFVPAPNVVLDKDVYNVGDTPRFTLLNPFKNAWLYLILSNALEQRVQIVELKEAGRVEVSLETALGSNFRGSSLIRGLLIYGRDDDRSQISNVPLSKAFDIGQPRTLRFSMNIEVAETELDLGNVEITTSAPVVAPGDAVEIVVKVNDRDNKPLVDGEVHLFVTDKKLLDLSPHPLLIAQDAYKIGSKNFVDVSIDSSSLMSLSVYRNLFENVQRRAAFHPWVETWFSDQADQSDEQFLSRYQSYLTHFGFYARISGDDVDADFGVTSTRAESANDKAGGFAPPKDAAGALPTTTAAYTSTVSSQGSKSRSASPGGEAAPMTRGAPVWTPLSVTARVIDGVAKFKIARMPDNLGVFRLGALATDGMAFARAESVIKSQKKFNVEPSLPRIARVDDRFKAGISVSSALNAAEYPVTLMAAVSVQCDFLGLLEDQTKKVVLTEAGAVRVEWGLEAIGVTPLNVDAKLWFTLLDASGTKQLDRLEATLPVLLQQPAVSVATSFAIEPTMSGNAWPEGVTIPEHVLNSAQLSIEAGVGRLPAIRFLSNKLLDAFELADDPSGEAAVGAVHVAALLDEYKKTLDEATATRINTVYKSAMARLNSLTATDVGLRQYQPQYYDAYVDIRLNLYAIWVAKSTPASLRETFGQLPVQWLSAVNSGLNQLAADARRWNVDGTFRNFDLLADVFWTLGFDWTLPNSPYAQDFTVARLFANVNTLSTSGSATLASAIYLHNVESTHDAALTTLLRGLQNKIRVQGRTAYITPLSGSQNVDIGASYVGLMAFAKSTQDKAARVVDPDQLIEKLANYVAAPRAPANNIWFEASPRLNSLAAAALRIYDFTRGNNMPSFMLRVKAGSIDLLNSTDKFTTVPGSNGNGVAFLRPDQSPARVTINANELPPFDNVAAAKKDDLSFFALGSSGEASVVVGIDFVPCERERDANGKLLRGPQCKVQREPVYRGISVEKTIRAFNPSTGMSETTSITRAESGTQVEITIQVTSPDALENVMVVDYLAAGLEAFPFAAPETSYSRGDSFFGGGGRGFFGDGGFRSYLSPTWWGWWTWAVFAKQEIRKDRVTAFAYNLPAGSSSFSYKALVVTPGEFALPPTKAFAQGQPELLGLSGGGKWGSQDAAWTAIDVARTARVCERDPILLLDGSTFSVVLPATPSPSRATVVDDSFGTAPSRGMPAGAIVAIVLALLVVGALVVFGIVKHFGRKPVELH